MGSACESEDRHPGLPTICQRDVRVAKVLFEEEDLLIGLGLWQKKHCGETTETDVADNQTKWARTVSPSLDRTLGVRPRERFAKVPSERSERYPCGRVKLSHLSNTRVIQH